MTTVRGLSLVFECLYIEISSTLSKNSVIHIDSVTFLHKIEEIQLTNLYHTIIICEGEVFKDLSNSITNSIKFSDFLWEFFRKCVIFIFSSHLFYVWIFISFTIERLFGKIYSWKFVQQYTNKFWRICVGEFVKCEWMINKILQCQRFYVSGFFMIIIHHSLRSPLLICFIRIEENLMIFKK